MPLTDLKPQYSRRELKRGPRRENYNLMTKYYESHHHDPHHTFLYGFLCLIYDGVNTLDDLKAKMQYLFISATNHVVIGNEDVEEYWQKSLRKKLIQIHSDDTITLTEEGKRLVEYSYFWNLHTSYWMGKFFSESTVLAGTAIFLVIISLLKILTGLDLGSQGMISEGFENLTDLIKIGIIVILGMKLNKDKIASFIIILLMLFTSGTLIWSSAESLINPVEIVPTVQAYIIGIVSIIVNIGLMFLKGMVGRISGNLSFLSDSKDSGLNVKLSAGVLIGLTFAIFKYYFVDAIVGIVISILVFKEGIEILIELAKKEEDFDITSIKVYADNVYNNRLTAYLLGNIRRTNISRSNLIKNFDFGLSLGRKYYEGFADFFYSELGSKIAEKHLDKLIEGNLIEYLNDILVLTPKGLKFFYRAKVREFRERAYNINLGTGLKWQHLICILFIFMFILITIFAPQINSWFASI
ncbi:MAG: cation diffusion facilitator family transporter [Candidatus Odinarchaeota archaeon]